ncbi:MAG: peptidase MA family metallohydrolase [Pseudomonadota bacterium]
MLLILIMLNMALPCVLAGPLWAAGAPTAPSSSPIPPLAIQAATPQLEAHVRQIVEETAPSLAAWIGARPHRLQIVVAASEDDFKARVAQLDGPRWAAGLAVPQQGLILVRSPRQLIEPEQFRLLLAHELTHLYLAAALRQREHPLWLEEGLAMYASGEGGWERAAVMAKGVLQGRLLPLAEMEDAFPSDPDQAALAYAQSYYMISYLINHHGQEVLPRVIAGLARGQALTTALKQATGQGLYALEQDFREEMTSRFSWLTVITAGGTLWALISLLAAFGLVARRRAHKARMAAMPDGEDTGGVHLMRRRWPPGPRPRLRVQDPPAADGQGSAAGGEGEEDAGHG